MGVDRLYFFCYTFIREQPTARFAGTADCSYAPWQQNLKIAWITTRIGSEPLAYAFLGIFFSKMFLQQSGSGLAGRECWDVRGYYETLALGLRERETGLPLGWKQWRPSKDPCGQERWTKPLIPYHNHKVASSVPSRFTLYLSWISIKGSVPKLNLSYIKF